MGKHVSAFAKGCLVALGLYFLDQTFKSETWLRDMVIGVQRLKHPQPPAPDVIIIQLTDESMAGYPVGAGAFRYPRQALADLIRAINLTQPGLIVLDVFLDEPGETAEDDALRAALVESRTKVLLAQDVLTDYRGVATPKPPLEKFGAPIQARPAFFEFGEQGMVRKLVPRIDGVETLPVYAATSLGHSALQGREKPVSLSYDWRGAESFRHIAAEGILEVYRTDPNQAFPELARLVTSRSVVLIAPYYRASRDFFPVPRSIDSPNGELRGSEVLGFAIRTAIKGPSFEPWDDLFWLWKFLIMVLCAGAGYGLSVWRTNLAKPQPIIAKVWWARMGYFLIRHKHVLEAVLILSAGGAVCLCFALLNFYPPLLTVLLCLLFGFKMDLPKVETPPAGAAGVKVET